MTRVTQCCALRNVSGGTLYAVICIYIYIQIITLCMSSHKLLIEFEISFCVKTTRRFLCVCVRVCVCKIAVNDADRVGFYRTLVVTANRHR